MSLKLLALCSLAVLTAWAIHSSAASDIPQSRAILGQSCNSTKNCTVFNSICNSTKKCACDVGYEEVNNKNCTIKLNATCDNSNRKCNRTGGSCVNSKCVCNTQHVISPNGQACLRLATSIGGVCQSDVQCKNLVNTSCDRNTCKCFENYEQTLTTACRPKVCSNINPCPGNNVQCTAGYCGCAPGAFLTHKGCYFAEKKLGQNCDAVRDICWDAEGSYHRSDCISNKCSCIGNFVPDKKKERCVSGATTVMASIGAVLITLFLRLVA